MRPIVHLPSRPLPRPRSLARGVPFAALAAALLLAACGGSTGPAGPIGTSTAMATGVVYDAGGAPVPNASVSLYAYATCSDSVVIGTGTQSLLLADGSGHYMARIMSDAQPGPECIEVRATRSRTDTTHVGSHRYGPVTFQQTNGTQPYDTAHVDVTLPATTSGARALR